MEIKEILQNQESQAAMKQDDITLIEIKDYIKNLSRMDIAPCT